MRHVCSAPPIEAATPEADVGGPGVIAKSGVEAVCMLNFVFVAVDNANLYAVANAAYRRPNYNYNIYLRRMAIWHVKALVQKVISFLPWRERVNYFFQRYVTKGVQLSDEHFANKLQHAIDHVTYFKKYGSLNQNAQILELGSGWYPVVPIVMFLCKAGKVVSYDIYEWMSLDREMTTIRKFKEWHENGKLKALAPFIDADNWDLLMGLLLEESRLSKAELNRVIGLTLVLGDARKLAVPNDSIDFICSNNTFEHIYPEVLSEILEEFQRIAKKGCVMSHFIDLSDHFAHFDKSITVYNFLSYSESAWRRIDNKIQPQNRLRWSDYKALYHQLKVPISHETYREGDKETLKQVDLAAEWLDYEVSDLAITHGYLVSVMP